MKHYIEHVWQQYIKTAEQLGLPGGNSLDCFCVHTTEQIEQKTSNSGIIERLINRDIEGLKVASTAGWNYKMDY